MNYIFEILRYSLSDLYVTKKKNPQNGYTKKRLQIL